MRYTSIKSHLCAYKILERRKTTINHAFAAAIHIRSTRIRESKALGKLGKSRMGLAMCLL